MGGAVLVCSALALEIEVEAALEVEVRGVWMRWLMTPLLRVPGAGGDVRIVDGLIPGGPWGRARGRRDGLKPGGPWGRARCRRDVAPCQSNRRVQHVEVGLASIEIPMIDLKSK